MYKRFVYSFILIILLVNTSIVAGTGAITLKVNDKYCNYSIKPLTMNNTPMVSLEMIFNEFEVEFIGDKNLSTIKGLRGEDKIRLRLGNKHALVNNKKIALDVAPIRINGNIMVSIDFIYKALGGKVDWDERRNSIEMYTDNKAEIHFIDVGHGDAIFIDYKNDDILIDCGNSDSGRIVANYLANLGVDDIELLVSTNCNSEHIDGIKEVMKKFNVKKIIFSGTNAEKEKITKNMKLMPTTYCVELICDRDSTIDLGNGVLFKVIELGGNFEKMNNNIVVTMLQHNSVKILFTGDMESQTEFENIDEFNSVNILKIANHGSNISTSNEFLDEVTPEVAVISSGQIFNKNEDEKNNQEIYSDKGVINRLEERNIQTYNTIDVGTVVITTDGKGYVVDTREVNGVLIRQIDFINQYIIVYNESHKDHDLSSYFVTDKKGQNTYYIEDGSTVEAGYQRIFDLVRKGKGEIEEKNEWIFRESFMSDKGVLYDHNWNVLSKYD